MIYERKIQKKKKIGHGNIYIKYLLGIQIINV